MSDQTILASHEEEIVTSSYSVLYSVTSLTRLMNQFLRKLEAGYHFLLKMEYNYFMATFYMLRSIVLN